MRHFLYLLATMKKSVLAFLLAAILGLLSMGVLGGLLYAAAYPVAGLWLEDPELWHGDRLWPTMILTGILWSPSFLVAGYVNLRLVRAGRGTIAARRWLYALILWLGAVAIWSLALSGAIRVS